MTRSFARRRSVLVALLCSASWALSLPASAQPQDAAKLAEAKQHMEAGAAFYNDPSGHKCEEAVREFSKAYELSGSKKALRAMGVCALELERDGDAIDYYDKYLAFKDVDAADRAQVENDLKALKSAVARVTIKSDRPTARITTVRTPSQGLPITNHYAVAAAGSTIGMHPGQYTITASADGSPDISWQTEIQNGGTYNKVFEFDKAKAAAPGTVTAPPAALPPTTQTRDSRPIPVTVWIFGGLTVASGATLIGTGVTALKKKKDYDAQNGKASQTELASLRSKVTTFNTVTDVFLGVTIASAAATAIFALTRPTVHSETTADKPTASWTVLPTAGATGGGATVLGSF